MPGRRAIALLCLAFAGCLLAGCGDGDDPPAEQPAPEERLEKAGQGPAAVAAPEAPPAEGGEEQPLAPDDEAAVRATVEAYVAALDRHDGAGVCELFAPGALPASELPVDRGGCAGSLDASIGTKPKGGAPAWKRTKALELTAVAVGDERARVTATVTHRFSDRKYVSVEEDVIYLDRVGAEWLLAQPSATLYRAVGYPEPPLRAFSPPPG